MTRESVEVQEWTCHPDTTLCVAHRLVHASRTPVVRSGDGSFDTPVDGWAVPDLVREVRSRLTGFVDGALFRGGGTGAVWGPGP